MLLYAWKLTSIKVTLCQSGLNAQRVVVGLATYHFCFGIASVLSVCIINLVIIFSTGSARWRANDFLDRWKIT